MLMSPRSTFHSCGSSSMLLRRMKDVSAAAGADKVRDAGDGVVHRD
jgi:hypothetical protein